MFLNDAGGRSVLCPLLVPSPTPAHVAMPDLPPVHWEHVEDTGLWTDECSYRNFCFENLRCRHSVPLCSAITPTGQRRGIQIHGKDGFGAMAMGAKLRRSCGLNICFPVNNGTMNNEQWQLFIPVPRTYWTQEKGNFQLIPRGTFGQAAAAQAQAQAQACHAYFQGWTGAQ